MADALRAGTWEALDSLNERERALLRVATKLSGEATRMTEADWEPLRLQGFSDEALLEVAHIVGIFNHLVRLADGLGLELDAATALAAQSERALGAK